jgi:hypothetical protein
LSIYLSVGFTAFGCGQAKNADQAQNVSHTMVDREPPPRDEKSAESQDAKSRQQHSEGVGETSKKLLDPSELAKHGEPQKSREEKKLPKAHLMQELRTPQGLLVRLSAEHDPWADAVVSFEHGKPVPKKNKNPWAAVGKPAGGSFALGHGGTLVLQFIDNMLVDGPGPDLVIIEVGKAIEPTHIWISENGADWIYVGRAAGSKSTVDIEPFVKPGQRFSYVRLRDAKAGKSKGSAFPGADINGVGALNSLAVPNAPSRKEIESRWKK